MKHSARKIIAFTLLLTAWCGGVAQAQNRIAKVNMRQLFEGYQKAKEQDASFKKRMAGVVGDAKVKREAFQKGKEELQKFQATPTDPAAVAKIKELKEMEQGILQFELNLLPVSGLGPHLKAGNQHRQQRERATRYDDRLSDAELIR